MTERERLIELIEREIDVKNAGINVEWFADYLLAKGVVVLPCKVGDTVWELCKCVDGIYRIFPMTVKIVCPYGSVRWIKDEEPSVWNIYATHDYTKMYKNFCDFDKTVFLTREEAERALKEVNSGE